MINFRLLLSATLIACAASFVSCGDDEPLGFTDDIIKGSWTISSVEGDSPWPQVKTGAIYTFNEDGTCSTPFSWEDSYKIVLGKVRSYHAENNEPMFIYELINYNPSQNFKARIRGTLNESYLSVVATFEGVKPLL